MCWVVSWVCTRAHLAADQLGFHSAPTLVAKLGSLWVGPLAFLLVAVMAEKLAVWSVAEKVVEMVAYLADE